MDRGKGERVEGKQGKGKSGKVERQEQEKGAQQDTIFYHHHPNFYDFFPRAIAPFTGIIL